MLIINHSGDKLLTHPTSLANVGHRLNAYSYSPENTQADTQNSISRDVQLQCHTLPILIRQRITLDLQPISLSSSNTTSITQDFFEATQAQQEADLSQIIYTIRFAHAQPETSDTWLNIFLDSNSEHQTLSALLSLILPTKITPPPGKSLNEACALAKQQFIQQATCALQAYHALHYLKSLLTFLEVNPDFIPNSPIACLTLLSSFSIPQDIQLHPHCPKPESTLEELQQKHASFNYVNSLINALQAGDIETEKFFVSLICAT